jgi:hypothetical protein
MGKLDKYHKINYDNNEYAVCELKYGTKIAPVTLNWRIFEKIKKLDRNWVINDKGFVVTYFKTKENGKDIVREISMHDVVMRIMDDNYDNRNNKTILHINKLGVDNRIENLMYDIYGKEIKKNIKKKARTITLPEETGITPEEIPSYVWYLKEDSSHGDRFVIEIGDINWKSTGSKKLSLRYKLEETKKYMRYLKDMRSDLFEEYSMNGDLNDDGKELKKSFVTISQTAGFKINYSENDTNTENYLKEDLNGLTDNEKMYLQIFNPEMGRLDFR